MWNIPHSLIGTKRKLVVQAGFGLEIVLTLFIPYPYLLGTIIHFIFYPWYAEKSNDFYYLSDY